MNKKKIEAVNAEVNELRSERWKIIQRAKDVLEEEVDDYSVQETLSYTIDFYKELIEYLEELNNELEQNNMFQIVALARARELKKKPR